MGGGVVSFAECIECGFRFERKYNRKFCKDLCNYRNKERRRVEAGYYQRPHVRARVNKASREKYRRGVDAGTESGALLKIWAGIGSSGCGDMPNVCVIGECLRPFHARGLCRNHYEREMASLGSGWAVRSKIWGNDYIRRAKHYGVAYGDFDKYAIFIRDGWICGICSENVDSALLYPHPMSPSLDHVIPLSRGGGHLLDNVQCSHLVCNVRKGDRDA